MIAPKRKLFNPILIGTIMKREYINEVAWGKIFSFLQQCRGIYVGSEIRCKNFVEAIYWMSRTGAQWRELHDYYGNWNSIYKRFNAWSKKNIWAELLDEKSTEPREAYSTCKKFPVSLHCKIEENFLERKSNIVCYTFMMKRARFLLVKIILEALNHSLDTSKEFNTHGFCQCTLDLLQ